MQLNAYAIIILFPAASSLSLGTAQFLSRPDLFKQIHLHTDVRLVLGWSGVFVAGATAFYSWRLEFEQSKPVMWIGLIVCVFLSRARTCCTSSPGLRYIILTLLQTLYAYFVEGDIIFVGKRKTFDKRVRLTLPRGYGCADFH